MTEAQIQYEILASWGSHSRLRLWRQNVGAGYVAGGRLVKFGISGCSDILGLLAPAGKLIGIEVKSAAGRQSEDQKRFERVITAFGGAYCLARSVEDVDAFMATLGVTR